VEPRLARVGTVEQVNRGGRMLKRVPLDRYAEQGFHHREP
jgi:hypothetical protein